MSATAQQVGGGILTTGVFVLMIAIVWFKYCDSRRIL